MNRNESNGVSADEEPCSEKGLLIEGAQAFFWDAIGFCLAWTAAGIAILALAAGIWSLATVVYFYLGIEIPQEQSLLGLWGWTVPFGHVVAFCVVLLLIKPWQWPAALKKRGKAERREKMAAAARGRLAAKGAYSDPSRNNQR